jgi:hypothetical protein
VLCSIGFYPPGIIQDHPLKPRAPEIFLFLG